MKTELNELVGNHHLVESLWQMVNTSAGSLAHVAPTVRRILETKAWAQREVPQLGQVVEFKCFADFITTPPLRGCGWPLEKVEALIRDDADTLRLWRQAVTPQHGGDHSIKNDNVILAPQQGNSRAYTLDRLQRVHPALYERVVAGELSAHAAAIEAGIRKPADALTELRRAWKRATADERAAFLVEVGEGHA